MSNEISKSKRVSITKLNCGDFFRIRKSSKFFYELQEVRHFQDCPTEYVAICHYNRICNVLHRYDFRCYKVIFYDEQKVYPCGLPF